MDVLPCPVARGEQTQTSDRHVGYIIGAVMGVVALAALTGVASVMNCRSPIAEAPNTEPFPHAHDRLGSALSWRLCEDRWPIGTADTGIQRSIDGRMEARGYTAVGTWSATLAAGEVSPTGLEGACGVVVAFTGEYDQVRVVRDGVTELGCQRRVASMGICGNTPVQFVGANVQTRTFLMIGLTDDLPTDRIEHFLGHAEAEMLLGGRYLGDPQVSFESLPALDRFMAPAPSEGCVPYVVVSHGASPVLEWDGVVFTPTTAMEWDLTGIWSCAGTGRQTELHMSADGEVSYRPLTQAPALSEPISMPTIGAAAVVDRDEITLPRAIIDLGAADD